jgi:hypothetical protein
MYLFKSVNIHIYHFFFIKKNIANIIFNMYIFFFFFVINLLTNFMGNKEKKNKIITQKKKYIR